MSDTMVSPDDSPPPDLPPPTSSPTPGGGGYKSWSKNKKLAVVGGGGLAVALIVYLFAKSRSSSSSSGSSNSTTPTLVLPSSNQDATDSTEYASLEEGLQGLDKQVQGLEPPPPSTGTGGGPPSGGKTPPKKTTTPVAPSGPPTFPLSYGAGIGNLDVVGYAQPGGDYVGYNVKGGAPVYAYVNGSWHLGLKPSQFTKNTPIGTPTNYSDLIDWQAGKVSETLGK